jgi:acyl-CoA synthetase (AMP-forming)/AMP-acid ligase II
LLMAKSLVDSFATRVMAHAAGTPDRRAVVCDGQALTYGALTERALRVAARLKSLGYEPGGSRRVGIISANDLDVVVIITGCHFAGLTVVPIPYLIMPDAQARARRCRRDDCLHDEPRRRPAVGGGPVARTRGHRTRCRSDTHCSMAGSRPLHSDPATIPDEPEWAADIIYSSGTTGTPKGIVQSYRVRAEACANIARFGVGDGTHLLQTVSIYSNFGIVAAYLTLWSGGTFHMLRKFSGPAVVGILARTNRHGLLCPRHAGADHGGAWLRGRGPGPAGLQALRRRPAGRRP